MGLRIASAVVGIMLIVTALALVFIPLALLALGSFLFVGALLYQSKETK